MCGGRRCWSSVITEAGRPVSSLRPYQTAALDAIARELSTGNNRILIQLATGLGKTFCAASLLKHGLIGAWLEQYPDSRVLFFVHREEIVDQAAEAFQEINPGVMVSIEQGPRRANRYADVVVASIQTLAASNGRRLDDLIRYRPFRVVVADECHRATSASYVNTLARLGFLPPADATDVDDDVILDATQLQANLKAWDERAPRDRLLLGMTATPNRTDGVGLAAVFQSLVFSYPLRKGIEDGYLVQIVPWVVDTSTNIDAVKMQRGDFAPGDLQKTINTEERNRLTVAGWLKKADGRPTIAFTAGVAHAHDLAAAFTVAGVSARAVSGETPKDERRQILADYRAGLVTVLTNAQVFTEGTDLPLTSCILMAKPTKSGLTYEQCVGRGLRLYEGKRDCILLDVVDIARKHSLQTAPVLYGLPPGLISEKAKTLGELAEAFEAFAEKHPGLNVEKMGRVAIEQLQVKATTFNLWEIPALGSFGHGRTMNWVSTAKDTFRVQFPYQDGVEVISIAPDLLGKFDVVSTFRPAVGAVRQRTLVSGVEAAVVAAEFAERFIESSRPGVLAITRKNASWRNDPASSRQLNMLRWRKIPHSPSITKGGAADLINLWKARSGQ